MRSNFQFVAINFSSLLALFRVRPHALFLKYVMHPTPLSPPPISEQAPLHSKSLCINMARASGGANNMQPLSWWGHKQKRSKITSVPGDAKFICPLSRGRGNRLEQIIFLFLRHIICKKWIFSVCAPPPPPSQYAMHPHTLCYHYVKIWHVCVGEGGGGRN